MSMSLQLPHAPSELVDNPLRPIFTISDTTYLVACLVFGALAVVALAYCVTIAVRERKLYPLFIWLGGAMTVVYEPLTDVLGGFTFPEFSQHAWVAVFGRRLPVYMGLVYCFYVAVASLWIVRRIERDGMTWQRWMTWWAASVPVAFAFELIPVNTKLWVYWGDAQPLALWNLPIWWCFANTAAVSTSAAFLYLVRKYVLGDRHNWVLMPLLPLGVIAVHMAVTFPAIAGISSSTDIRITTLGAIGTIVLSGAAMLLFGMFLQALAPDRASRTESAEPAPVAMAAR
jgi:hypothetical protein